MQTLPIAAILLAVAALPGPTLAHAGESSALASKFHTARTAPSDLEISGQVPGIPAKQSRFLAREDLLAISQPVTISPDDGNFKNATEVLAVALENIARALGIPSNEIIVADCKDKYQAHYPRSYVAAHHPALVTEMNGAVLSDAKEDDYGPYMIAHERFTPAFKILAHSDEPQIPWGVTGLQFRDEKTFWVPIAPNGPHGSDQSVRYGYEIAKQNCLRCHDDGYTHITGGTKSAICWSLVGSVAKKSPEFFTAYVRDPKAQNPNTRMAGSPEYDDATMAALIAYFRLFPEPLLPVR